MNNPYMGNTMAHTMATRNPCDINYSNVNIGFTNTNPNFCNELPKTTTDAKPNILGFDKEHQLHFDIHANSKQYYSKDNEYLAHDHLSKPGKTYSANQKAVMLNEPRMSSNTDVKYANELEAQVAANKYQMLNEIAMNNNHAHNHAHDHAHNHPQNMPMNQFGQTGINCPMPMPKSNNLQFMPNMNNTDLQNQAILQRNINSLGGIKPVIPQMNQTLLDNEMKYINQHRGGHMNTNHNTQNTNMSGLNAHTMNNMQNTNMSGLNAHTMNNMEYPQMPKSPNYMQEGFDPMNLKPSPFFDSQRIDNTANMSNKRSMNNMPLMQNQF